MIVDRRGLDSEKGSVLVTALGVLSVLALMAMGGFLVFQGNLRLLSRKTDSLKAFYCAEAGVAVGESALLRAFKSGDGWIEDESFQDENAYPVVPPLTSLQEVEPRLSDVKILIDVVDGPGVYRIRSYATITGSYGPVQASVVKHVVVDPYAGGGGVSPEFLDALDKIILSGGDITLQSHAIVSGSVHSNGRVTIEEHAMIEGNVTDADDEIRHLPTIADLGKYAQSKAESVRSEYSGGWTSNPNNLVGNVHLKSDLFIDAHRTVRANLWVEGNVQISSHVKLDGDLFVEGNCFISSHVDVYGDVFVRGPLTIGSYVNIDGSVYVYDPLGGTNTFRLSEHSVINGNLVSAANVEVASHAKVHGSVLSGGSITFSEHSMSLGTSERGALVYAARDITVRSHGLSNVVAVIAHGWVDLKEHARVYRSDLNIDPELFALFPGPGVPAIVDSYWGA